MFCKEQKIFKTISVAEALRSDHTMYVRLVLATVI